MIQSESEKHSLNLALSIGSFLILSVFYSIVLVDPKRGCEQNSANKPQQFVSLEGRLALYSPGYIVVSIPNQKPIKVIRCGTGKRVSMECLSRLKLLKEYLGSEVSTQACGAIAFETRTKSDNFIIWSESEAQTRLERTISSRNATRLMALAFLIPIFCFGLYSAYKLQKLRV